MKFFISRAHNRVLDKPISIGNTTDHELVDEVVEKTNTFLFANKDKAYTKGIEIDSFPSTFTLIEKVRWINSVSEVSDIAIDVKLNDQKTSGVAVYYVGESSLQQKEASVFARILSNNLGLPNLGAVADTKKNDRKGFVRDINCRSYLVVIGSTKCEYDVKRIKEMGAVALYESIMKVFLSNLIREKSFR